MRVKRSFNFVWITEYELSFACLTLCKRINENVGTHLYVRWILNLFIDLRLFVPVKISGIMTNLTCIGERFSDNPYIVSTNVCICNNKQVKHHFLDH